MKKAEVLSESGVGLGAPRTTLLTYCERISLQQRTQTMVDASTEFLCYQRFTSNGYLFHTQSYSSHVKRCDCAIKYEDCFYLIEKCLSPRKFCNCPPPCHCPSESYVLCTQLVALDQPVHFDNYSRTDLYGSIVKEVRPGPKVALCMNDVKEKCVYLKLGNKGYVSNLHKFEID